MAVVLPPGVTGASISPPRVTVSFVVAQQAAPRRFTVTIGTVVPAEWLTGDTWSEYRLEKKDELEWTRQIAVTGNTKYESPRGPVPAEERVRVRGDWHRVIVFGSVRRDEAEALAHALDALREIPGPLLLVVALRHPDGADALRRRLEVHGLPILERRELGGPLLPSVRSVAAASTRRDPDTLRAILLVTTVGELRGFYAAADLAFVGGTLCPVGGHSLFEPAELGVPVFYGSHVSNVADVAAVLEAEGGGFRAATGLELGQTLAGLATSPEECRTAAGAALRGAERVGGAVGRTLDALEAWGFPIGEVAGPLAEGRSDGLA